jgi:hypothetical protein
MTATNQLIDAPASDSNATYTTLGYVDAYDAVLNCDYAFVAYRESRRDSSDWRLRVRSSQTAGGEFDPAAIIRQARACGAQGKPYFTWGYSFDPSPSDPRQIEFRVYVVNGQPTEVEIYVRLRKFDGTAGEPKSVKFPWPTA